MPASVVDDVCVTTVDLLRHGVCEGGEIFRGSTDVPLTQAGWTQMTAALAPHRGWHRIVCSSLQRCCRFAEAQAEKLDLPWRTISDLREISFGAWEGRLIADVEREQGDLLRRFWNDPANNCAPDGETLADFRERVVGAVAPLLAEHSGEHLLFVTHGAVVRLLMCEWLQMPLTAFSRVAVPYGCLTRFQFFHVNGKAPWVQLVLHGRGSDR